MDKYLEWARPMGAVVAASCVFIFGSADMWLYSLIALVTLDYITGVSAAYIKKELSSRVGFTGIIKKLLLFAIVAVANIADNLIGASGVLKTVAVGFLIANEGLSILENCGRCGLNIPPALLEALEQLKNKKIDK